MRQGLVVLRLSKQRKEEESGAAIQQGQVVLRPSKKYTNGIFNRA